MAVTGIMQRFKGKIQAALLILGPGGIVDAASNIAGKAQLAARQVITVTAVANTECLRSHRLTAAASDALNVAAAAGAVKHRGDECSRSFDRRVAARDRRTGVTRRRNRR